MHAWREKLTLAIAANSTTPFKWSSHLPQYIYRNAIAKNVNYRGPHFAVGYPVQSDPQITRWLALFLLYFALTYSPPDGIRCNVQCGRRKRVDQTTRGTTLPLSRRTALSPRGEGLGELVLQRIGSALLLIAPLSVPSPSLVPTPVPGPVLRLRLHTHSNA